ncbi:hypothetical protein RKD33_000360 [Streptomyces sp. SAI-129]
MAFPLKVIGDRGRLRLGGACQVGVTRAPIR